MIWKIQSNPNTQFGFVHRFLPQKREDSPTLLVIHGIGGSEEDLIRLAEMIDNQATIPSPRGKVLENGLPQFFRRFAERKFDI